MGIGDRVATGALLVASALLLALPTGAQEETPPAPDETRTRPTALERSLERPGILLVKRSHPLAPVDLGGGGKLRLEAVAVHEPGMQHQRVMGVRIDLDPPELAGEERTFYVDVHEIEALVRAIEFMAGAAEQGEYARERGRTEMSISTQDGLRLEVRFAPDRARRFLRTPSASFAVSRAAFETLRARLNEARAQLFSD
jgi:hypothetical protein